MRIGLLDLEVAPNIAVTWGIHDQTLRYSDLISEWFIISMQYQLLEDKKVSYISVLNDKKRFKKNYRDDYAVVKRAYDFLQEVDVIVGHNIKNYDLKKLKAKFLEHKLPPIEMPFVVDTLVWARKYGFTSRKLGDLCKKLELTQKLSHEPGDFILAAQGNVDAIKRIVKYGIGDIPTLKDLYLILRPYENHPNQNAFKNYPCCVKCGSARIHKRGTNKTGEFITWACYDCRARFVDKNSKKLHKIRFK